MTPLRLPFRNAKNLTTEVFDRIAAEINSGRIAPGGRLPTELELMGAMGVSRTVVREAVAALKADGLVVTRQGAGAFVSPDGTRVPFRIDPAGLSSISDVICVMELRLAVEVEAAALAAERADPAAITSIEASLHDMDCAIGAGGPAITEDFAFHAAISAATGNAYYVQFLTFLGHHVIPRQSVRTSIPTEVAKADYLNRLQREHRAIFSAISGHDAAASRTAMRSHLENSLVRYRNLAGAAEP